MSETERPEHQENEPAGERRKYDDDRRTSLEPPRGDDPREIDDEYASDEQLEVTLKQDQLNNPRPGHEGMGTSSDRAPGTDLPESPEGGP